MNENRDLNQRENGINPSELSGKGDYYFSNGVQERTPRTTPVGTKRKPAKKGNGVKSTYVFFIVVIAVSMALSVYAVFCMNDILAITKTKSTVTVSMQEEVKTASDAIDLLADQGLIKCKGFCKFFATLHDKVLNDPIGGPYPAGVYYLNGKMGLEGMLQTLQGSSATSETVTLIFPEGMTVPEIVNKLTENDVCDKTALLSVIDSTEFTYSMVADLKANEHVPYRLEGFMFPDTYEFYVKENADSALSRLLSNFQDRIMDDPDVAPLIANSSYSLKDIVIMASLIEKETDGTDRAVISSVIHNRLENVGETAHLLQIDASLVYAAGREITEDDYQTLDSPYNLYTHQGLPPTAIANAGKASIVAALKPDKTNYYFYVLNPDTQRHVFSRTLTEHNANLRKFG